MPKLEYNRNLTEVPNCLSSVFLVPKEIPNSTVYYVVRFKQLNKLGLMS